MYVAVFLACALAGASAAPFYEGFRPQFDQDMEDLNQEVGRLFSDLINQYTRSIPIVPVETKLQGKHYMLKMALPGFEEKDIEVKVRRDTAFGNAVIIQASRAGRQQTTILNLPDNVNIKGTWDFTDEVLEVKFPVNEVAVSTEDATELNTDAPIPTDTDVWNEMTTEDGRENVESGEGLKVLDLKPTPRTYYTEFPTMPIRGKNPNEEYEFVNAEIR